MTKPTAFTRVQSPSVLTFSGQSGPLRWLWTAFLIISFLTVAPVVSGQQFGVSAKFTGTSQVGATDLPEVGIASPRGTQATPTPTAIVFGSVALATSTPPQLTASFAVSGYSGTFTPTAVAHYGLDYTLGAVSCTGSAPPETCTVTVTFNPTLPGVRRDALFLMSGTTRLATVLISGIGTAPMALVQPGIVTPLVTLGPSSYFYGSAVDENQNVYVIQGTHIDMVTAAGVQTVLPLVGLSNFTGLAIDGAGVLYIACSTGCSQGLATYDTVQGIQGSVTIPGTAYYPIAVAVGTSGNVYALDEFGPKVYKIQPDGTITNTTVTPSIQPSQIAVDAAENVFFGGNEVNEMTVGGIQTTINQQSSMEGIAVDAAESLYATRYIGVNGVAELPVSDYSNYQVGLDNGSPLGLSLGSNGTLYVGNYNVLDKVDRGGGAINFGAQYPGNTFSTATTTIYNGGNQPLVFSAVTVTGTAFQFVTLSGTNCATGTSLPPGAICSIGVSATPTHNGTFTGSLTVTTNSLNRTASTQTSSITVTQYGSYFSPSVAPLAFPSQIVNTPSNAAIETISNTGNSFAGTLQNATSSDPAFTIDRSACSAALATGATCPLSIVFKPTAVQAYTATITLTWIDSQTGAVLTNAFTATGTGITAPTPQAVLSATAVTFANQIVNTTSAAQSVTLSNSGNAALNITGISITGSGASNFAQTNNCGSSVAAGATCTISVTFTPGAATSYIASVSIADNAAGSPQTISVAGTGIPAPAPVVSLAPPSLTFAGTTVGTTSASQSITVSNTGNATLNISSISLTGANAGSFSTGGTCGSTLAAGSSCAVTVTFTPTAASSLSATVTIADNAAGSPHTAALTGTGVAPPIPQAVLTPATLTFATTTVGANSAAQTVVLSNPGTGPLTISAITVSGANASSFAQTNTCGATLAVAATCSISVTFGPTAAGSQIASITLTDNAAGSPHTVALSGTGTAPDFSLTTSGASQTIRGSGGMAQYTFSASGTNGTYSSPITFSVTGLPSGVTAAFAPPSITPGNATASTTLTLTIAPLSGDLLIPDRLPRSGGTSTPLFSVSVAGVLLCFLRSKRNRLASRYLNLLC